MKNESLGKYATLCDSCGKVIEGKEGDSYTPYSSSNMISVPLKYVGSNGGTETRQFHLHDEACLASLLNKRAADNAKKEAKASEILELDFTIRK